MPLVPTPKNCDPSVKKAIQILTQKLGLKSNPTFNSLTLGTLTLSGLTQGSVVFVGASGVISQDNSNLFWDDTVNGLGIGTKTQVSLLEVNGALGLAIETVTGNTTLDKTHSTLLVNASGDVTITLPTAASAYNSTDGIGRIYTVKKIDADANTVTIDGNGSETIDGATTAVITIQYESVTIQSDGSNWHIL